MNNPGNLPSLGADIVAAHGFQNASHQECKISKCSRPEEYALSFWILLSQDQEFFRHPKPEGFGLPDIIKEIDPGMYVRDDSKYIPEQERKEIAHSWTVRMPDGRDAIISESPEGCVWVNASRLEIGISGGAKLYVGLGSYAAANGKRFIGDPYGLSEAALVRRTENMLNSALREGTTQHLAPHYRQEDPAGYEDSPINPYIRPINWVRGDDANNLGELLLSSYHNVRKLVPEIENVRYNFNARRFEAGGREVGDEYFAELAKRSLPELRRKGLHKLIAGNEEGDGGEQARSVIGSGALKRAALTGSVLRGEGREDWGAILARLGEHLSGQHVNRGFQRLM